MVQGLKKVDGIQTTDGKLFTDFTEAASHQMELNFEKALEVFAHNHFYNGMEKSAIVNVIKENREELLAVLKTGQL